MKTESDDQQPFKITPSETVSKPSVRVDGHKEYLKTDEFFLFDADGDQEQKSIINDYIYAEGKREAYRHRQIMAFRKLYSRLSFTFLQCFAGFCALVILLQGFGGVPIPFLKYKILFFHLDEVAMTTLIGGTAVSVIGLVLTILNSIFPKEPADSILKKPLNKLMNKNIKEK